MSLEFSGNDLFVGTDIGKVCRYSFCSASCNSLFTYKIPYSGDSLNNAYSLLAAPPGTTISLGGAISWTPHTDSASFENVTYVVSDDFGHKDTTTFYLQVNAQRPVSAKQLRFQPKQRAEKHSHMHKGKHIPIRIADRPVYFYPGFRRENRQEGIR